MGFDPANLPAILAIAVVTYACRGGGYWLFRRIKPTPLLRAILAHVPGTLFVSFVVPSVLSGALQPAVGAAATAAAMVVTRSLITSIIAGVGAAWVVWAFR